MSPATREITAQCPRRLKAWGLLVAATYYSVVGNLDDKNASETRMEYGPADLTGNVRFPIYRLWSGNSVLCEPIAGKQYVR